MKNIIKQSFLLSLGYLIPSFAYSGASGSHTNDLYTETFSHTVNGFDMGCQIRWPQNISLIGGTEYWVNNPCFIDAPSGAHSGTVGFDYEADGDYHWWSSPTPLIPSEESIDPSWSYTGSSDHFEDQIWLQLDSDSGGILYWDNIRFSVGFWYMGGGGVKNYVQRNKGQA